MAESTIVTVEDTIQQYLITNLPNVSEWTALGFAIANVTFCRGGRTAMPRSPCIVLDAGVRPWRVSSNPNTQFERKVDSGICVVVGVLEKQERAGQELQIRQLGIAIKKALNLETSLEDVTTGKEIYGWAAALQTSHAVAATTIFRDADEEAILRTVGVEYVFEIPHNL